MSMIAFLIAAVFLPLFPLSMVFNRLFAQMDNVWMRMGLLLLWPQIGALLLAATGQVPPVWLVYWAVLTACLYAFRAVSLRELGLWTSHMATSAWSFLWLSALFVDDGRDLALQAAGFSAPFVLLAWLVARVESIFGAAYAGAVRGLAQNLPRLSGILVVAILAAVATPVFPGFFNLLKTVTQALPVVPWAALAVLLVWLLWAWSGARITRGLVVGPGCADPKPDLSRSAYIALGLVLLLLILAGLLAWGQLP
ncbi:MAG: hypothetical protein H6955_19415 [Chromatiaceae bacterium]|nr:hypothetical protein [Chromatiaceae bacterium]